jgi:hypothetical protein
MKLELSHDILAKKIYDLASTEDKMTAKISRFVSNRYAFHKETSVLLTQKDLNYIAPYIHKVPLDKPVENFLRKSSRRSRFNRFALMVLMVHVVVILTIVGLNSILTFNKLSGVKTTLATEQQKFENKKADRAAAQQKVQELLEKSRTAQISQSDLEDLDSIVKIQLIVQNVSLNKQQANTRQQRDFAQSGTLSNLAEEALDQEDYKYSIQLATKAWELNPQNEQALEILEELSESEQSLESLPQKEIKTILLQLRKKHRIGKLKKKDLKAIFAKENIVGQQSSDGVKEHVKDEAQEVKPQELERKEVVTPVFSRVMQQEARQVEPPRPVANIISPEVIAKLDCDLTKKNLGKWKRIVTTKRYTLFFKYTTASSLHFKLEISRSRAYIPSFHHLNFFNKEGNAKQVEITKIESSSDEIIYATKLTAADKAMLKKEKISALSFISSGKYSPHEIKIPSSDQIYFLSFSKCVL